VPKPYELPKGLEALLSGGSAATEIDELTYLQGELEYAESIIEDQKVTNAKLEVDIKILRDNTVLKKQAVKYAIRSLWIIPGFCGALLLLGATRQNFWDSPWIEVSLPKYAQAALIITPIIFFAAVIRQLIASLVSSGTASTNDDFSETIKLIKEVMKQSGQ